MSAVRRTWCSVVVGAALSLLLIVPAFAVPAFPGAEGGGAASVGGRGGTVIEVTNLNDSGTGSLREACEASEPRIVVFRVGGYINLNSTIAIWDPYITIAGQTAPGGSITLRASPSMTAGGLMHVYTHDVVIRYLRFRVGGTGFPSQQGSGLCFYQAAYNVVVDHCSMSWAHDENVTVWGSTSGNPKDMSFQWNVVSEGLLDHSCGQIVGTDSGATEMVDIDIHHCLFAHNTNRSPYIKGMNTQCINNIVYDWGWFALGFGRGHQPDIVGNYYKRGPSDQDRYEIQHNYYGKKDNYGPPGDPSVYIVGNKGPHQPNPDADNWIMIEETNYFQPSGVILDRAYQRFTPQTRTYPITVHSVNNIDSVLLNEVGASHRLNADGTWTSNRDAVDARIITEYQNGTGTIPTSPDDVGGYPVLDSGTPYTDSDHDGMADTWETTKFGNLSRNGTGDLDGDGYTDLEEFLNGTDPGAGSPPVANFTGNPTSGAAPLTVNFTDTSTNSPTSWSWNFGDGGTSTAQNPSHQYTTANQYTVGLTATNAYGSDNETKTSYITVTSGGGSVPTFVAAGSVASGAGAVTPALPSGLQSNDILLLFLETANQAISISNQNGGSWTEVTNSPQGTGAAGGASATRLTAFWSRYNGTQGAPTVSDSGNHQVGLIIAVRGCVTTGNPWNVTAGGVESTSDTSGAIPGATTTVANTLVVAAIATDLPDANGTANFSAWANSNLTNVAERTDNTRNAGNGGGLAIATGEKATAGAYGNTTVTCGTSAIKGMMSIALKP